VQAYIFYRLVRGNTTFEPTLGRSYLGTLCMFIPRSVWPDRPPTKTLEGTELQRGKGRWNPNRESSLVYGLSGEAMLNFGPYAAPLAMAIWGLLVGWVGRIGSRFRPGDMRLLLVPLLANLCIVALSNDSDNVLFHLVKNGLFPAVAVVLGSRHMAVSGPAAGGEGPAT
jgi:hypothetical protein